MDSETQSSSGAAGAARGTEDRGDRVGDVDPRELPPTDAVKHSLHAFAELREYFSYFVAAKLDGIKLSLRRAGIFAALGIVALLAGSALVVTAVVMVCAGLAQLIAQALDGRAWAGNLIVGLGVLLLVGGGTWFGMSFLTGKSRKWTVKKYELRRTRQRADFGHDVHDVAREARPRRNDDANRAARR
jgi:hypothetical protein